jgi:hypothetical protein
VPSTSTKTSDLIKNPVVIASLTTLYLCFLFNPLTNIELSALVAWVAPSLLGPPIGVWAGWLSYRRSTSKIPVTSPLPKLDAALVGIVSLSVAGTATFWSVRNLLQGIGTFADGSTTLVTAQLAELEEQKGRRRHCRQYATFQISGPPGVKICVSSIPTTPSNEPLPYGVPITLQVVTNFTGSRVDSVVVP